MVSVSVLRLIQMEAVLEKRIASMYRHSVGGATVHPPLLPFSETDLPRGWRTRALLLVDDLRRTILKDVDHGSRRDEVKLGDGERPHDETYIEGVLDFFKEERRQPIPNDPTAPETELKQTLSLLDICAVVRLTR